MRSNPVGLGATRPAIEAPSAVAASGVPSAARIAPRRGRGPERVCTRSRRRRPGSRNDGSQPRRRHSRSPTHAGRSCRAASRTRPSPPIPAPRSLQPDLCRASRPAPSEHPPRGPRCDTPPRTAPAETPPAPTASTPATSLPSPVASTPSKTAVPRRGAHHHRSRPNATQTRQPPPPHRPPARRAAMHHDEASSRRRPVAALPRRRRAPDRPPPSSTEPTLGPGTT